MIMSVISNSSICCLNALGCSIWVLKVCKWIASYAYTTSHNLYQLHVPPFIHQRAEPTTQRFCKPTPYTSLPHSFKICNALFGRLRLLYLSSRGVQMDRRIRVHHAMEPLPTARPTNHQIHAPGPVTQRFYTQHRTDASHTT